MSEIVAARPNGRERPLRRRTLNAQVGGPVRDNLGCAPPFDAMSRDWGSSEQNTPGIRDRAERVLLTRLKPAFLNRIATSPSAALRAFRESVGPERQVADSRRCDAL